MEVTWVNDVTEIEAEKCLAEYRALIKAWTMCVVGINPGDSDVIGGKLDAGEPLLLQIADEFPDKAHSVDLLVNARKRTWAGYEEERVPRAQPA